MNASVTCKKLRYIEKCETCPEYAHVINWTEPQTKTITVTYKCPNGHEFVRTEKLK